jgi:hypothetical protein
MTRGEVVTATPSKKDLTMGIMIMIMVELMSYIILNNHNVIMIMGIIMVNKKDINIPIIIFIKDTLTIDNLISCTC